MRIHTLLIITVVTTLLWGCKQPVKPEVVLPSSPWVMYSTTLNDTFYISVTTPPGYSAASGKEYPVVYVLDANVWHSMLDTVIQQWHTGEEPPIVIGIGYRDFEMLDSLRCRDYTYPVADAAYEMSVSGGADNFLRFLTTELIPATDSLFATDADTRTLMGHSLGGYFSMYALMQQLQGKHNGFTHYIASSPSVHYNNYYLLNRLNALPETITPKPVNLFVAFGSEEDKENEEDEEEGLKNTAETITVLNRIFATPKFKSVTYKAQVMPGLGHLDTPAPTVVEASKQ